MMTLRRNLSVVYYSLYSGSKTPVVDTKGHKTGEYTLAYESVTPIRANVSGARGTAELEQFGANLNYSKTMVLDNIYCPIDETTHLWIGFGAIDDFSPDFAHSEGELVVYNGKIYRAIADSPAGVFVSANWEEVKHNYIVVGVSKTLNSISYALREVDVS